MTDHIASAAVSKSDLYVPHDGVLSPKLPSLLLKAVSSRCTEGTDSAAPGEVSELSTASTGAALDSYSSPAKRVSLEDTTCQHTCRSS